MKKTPIDFYSFADDIVSQIKKFEEEYWALTQGLDRLREEYKNIFDRVAVHEEKLDIIIHILNISLDEYYEKPTKNDNR